MLSNRGREIYAKLTELDNKASSDKRNLTSEEEALFNGLIIEFNSLPEVVENRKEMYLSDFKKVKAYMTEPDPEGNPPFIWSDNRSSSSQETRIYNKSNLKKLRSFIKSKAESGQNEEYNFGRLVRALITGDNAPELRTLGTATGGGGYLIQEELSSIVIPMALDKSQVMTAGAYMTPMDQNSLVIPKIASMPATEWKAENSKFNSSTDMSFTGINLTAKTVMALIKISKELAIDGLNIEQTIERAISQAIADEIDRVALEGAGGLEPKGIVNTDDVLTENVSFTPFANYNHFSSAYYKVLAENGNVGALIGPSSMYAKLDLLKDKNNNPLQPPLSWSKYTQLASNKLTNNAVMGDYRQLIIGMRNQFTLNVSEEAGDAFEKLQVWIRAFVRVDIGIKMPQHLCVIRNIGEVSS